MLVKKIIKFTLPIFITSIYSTCSYGYQKSTDTTPPQITYTEERIGDRESLRVTVTATDESGIQEFRDPQGNTIIGDSITMEFNRRTDSTFIAIDNFGNQSELTIDLTWINPHTSNFINNKELPLLKSRKNNSSTYWSSSNIREWLNSNEFTVNYTSNSPTNENTGGYGYNEESGFLSQFTKDEIDAIAITNHRVWLNDSLDKDAKIGGNGDAGHLNYTIPTTLSAFPHVAFNYKNYAYKEEKDKVYLLSPFEVYWYLERRDFETRKRLTIEAQNRLSLGNSYNNWYLLGATNHGNNEIHYGVSADGNMRTISTGSKREYIVPALNIKPDYVFENGDVAKNLKIGDKVFFGKYMNHTIEWDVINISDSGYPMLLSSYAIDSKSFDSKGDLSRTYSDYIQYTSADLNLIEGVEYKSTNGSDDVNIPVAHIINEDDLINKRHNSGFSLDIEFEDLESGIKYIVLPDGTKYYDSNTITYTFDKNGEYIFGVMDNAGNFNKFGVPIGNINQEPELSIETNSNTWVNTDSLIYLRSSNTVEKQINDIILDSQSSQVEYGSSSFPNYIAYNGRDFKVSGTVELISYDPSVVFNSESLNLGFHYHARTSNDGFTYKANPRWATFVSIPVSQIIEEERIKFEFNITVPNDYYKNLQPWGKLNFNNDLSKKISIKLTGLSYSIVDDSDFSIESIILNDGTLIENVKEYTDVITEEGVHTLNYKVIDNRGAYTEKTITVKVDKTKPTLDLNYNLDDIYTNKELIVNINASDSLSGLKHIRHPDGTTVSSSNSSFKITKNGTYTFQSEDVAGNIQSETLNITGIDEIVEAEESVDFAETNPTQESISYARSAVNNLPESMQKDILQDRLNSITNLEDMKLERKTVSSNLDVYIKCENLLSMSLNTNSISFDNYSGVEDMEKLGAIELTINSSLPYDLNAYLEGDIQNSDKSAAMDIDMLKIKDNSKQDYQSFINTIDKVILKEDCPSGNYIYHNIDLKLESNNAYSVDVYKTTIKFEVVQK